MTWVSHAAVNGAVSYALFQSPVITAGAVAAAGLPDQLENIGRLPHRGILHALALWCVALVAWYFLFAQGAQGNDTAWRTAGFGVIFGGALHIAMDMFSVKGVPLLPVIGPNIRVGIYATRGISEYLFVATVVLVAGSYFGIFLSRSAGSFG